MHRRRLIDVGAHVPRELAMIIFRTADDSKIAINPFEVKWCKPLGSGTEICLGHQLHVTVSESFDTVHAIVAQELAR